MRRGARFVLRAAPLLCCGACTKLSNRPPESNDVPPVVHLTSSPVLSPYASAGDRLEITLLDPVGSTISTEGQCFHARVVDAVRDSDGAVLVDAGAPVAGEIARAHPGIAPLLALDLVSVSTRDGPARVTAMLEGARRVDVLDTGEVYDPSSSPYDAFFSAWFMPGPLGYSAPGAGTGYGDFYDAHEDEILVPAGAHLSFVLRAPLTPHLAPGEDANCARRR